MRKFLCRVLPFLVMPVFIPIYQILDSLILVEVFGCGCVPSTQTNMLNIPFNANDLRMIVFTVLTLVLSVWGIQVAKSLKGKASSVLYCAAVVIVNAALALWVIKTFMWA